MRTIRWGNIDGTLLLVFARVQPDEREFAAYIADATAMGMSVRRALVFSDIALTADQRRQVLGLRHSMASGPVAVITHSRVTRLIVTALNWTQRTRRAFHPKQIAAAFEYLQVQEPQRSELLEHALQFARDLNHAELADSLHADTPEGA